MKAAAIVLALFVSFDASACDESWRLVKEHEVKKGEHYVVADYGDLGQTGDALVCQYEFDYGGFLSKWQGQARSRTVVYYKSIRGACPYRIPDGQ